MKKTLFMLLIFAFSNSLWGQAKQPVIITGDYYSFEMNDGNSIIGKVIDEDDNNFYIQSESLGDITLVRNQVKRVKTMIEVAKGKAWFPNPHETRYLFMPSAFSLAKGEAYYQNTYILFNSINYGITDRFTLGGGFSILGLFPTILPGQYILTPKYSAPMSDNFHFGGGLLLGFATNPSFFSSSSNQIEVDFGGILYTMGTLGNREKNLTLGVGFAYGGGEVSRSPVITFSGMTRLGRKLSFVSENWWIPGTDVFDGGGTLVVSYALRIFGEKMSIDIGFFNQRDIFEVFPLGIPWLDFAYKF